MSKENKGKKTRSAVKIAKARADHEAKVDSGEVVNKQDSLSVGPHDEGFNADGQDSNAANPHGEPDDDD